MFLQTLHSYSFGITFFLSVSLSAYLSTCLSVCYSVCLSLKTVCPLVCLAACLSYYLNSSPPLGGRMSTCQTNGTWSRDPLHCGRIDCGAIKLANGEVAYVNDTAYQSLAYLTCGHGFVLVGGSLR